MTQTVNYPELKKINFLSNQFTNYLQTILEKVIQKENKAEFFQQSLLTFVCQQKNHLNHKHFQERSISQKNICLIEQIVFEHIKKNQKQIEKIGNILIDHILSHQSCYIAYLFFYKINRKINNKMLKILTFQKIKKINIKVIAFYQQQANEVNFLHSLKKPCQFKKCEDNLIHFLSTQQRPLIWNKNYQQTQKPKNSKIPPLLLPTSKSISSSRYSNSKQSKRKGIQQLHSLGQSLGEGFIAIQLGILLSNKRTQQVKQFSDNSQFRQKCLEKIQTDRLNSSRLSVNQQQKKQKVHIHPDQANIKNYCNILIINANLLLLKLELENQLLENHQIQKSFLRQYFDMSLVQIIKINQYSYELLDNKIRSQSFSNFGQIKITLHSLQKIIKTLIQKCSFKSQQQNLLKLLNRNKQNSAYHFSETSNKIKIKDQLLNDIKIIKINGFKTSRGPVCAKNDNLGNSHKTDIVEQDFVAEYILHYLKQLFAFCDMNKTKFYIYEKNLLNLLSLYLNCTVSKSTPYLITERLFSFLILIKRQVLQLSHPFINKNEYYQNFQKQNENTSQNAHQKNLVIKYPQLFSSFLLILGNLMTNNKHHQKLISNVFLKNIYFMETLQFYSDYVFQQQRHQQAISVLQFYIKAVKIYQERKNRNQQSKTLKIIFQNIGEMFLSPNGCICKTLKKYEYLINPSNGEQEQNFCSDDHFFFKYVLKFVSEVYYLAAEDLNSSILQQETASFYIKFSMINFVKLYSSLTVNQLVKAKINSKQILTTKESPHISICSNVNEAYMIHFLKILSSISINRTPEIAKKIRQYRILQFFVRQLQLQFSVLQNIQKYIKKGNKTKEVQIQTQKSKPKFQTEGCQKLGKIKIPSLNLGKQSNSNQKQLNKKQKLQQDKQFSKTTKLGLKIPALKLPLKGQKNQQQQQNETHKIKRNCLDHLLQSISRDSKVQKQKQKSIKSQLTLQLSKLALDHSDRAGTAKSSQRHLIYYQERKVRKIYSSKWMHAQGLLLVLSLVLSNGLLDNHYCDQFPISHGKTNVLYILHYHLNHEANRSVIPLIGQLVSKIKPYLCGQRLLKLLTNSFTDLSHYKEWKKINAGAYGVIYSCQTNINEPKHIAIKQMNFPKSIYERCVLHDIFTEITCLENFRLDDRITKMYNYGVVDNTYVIIMKKYQCSLREWILERKNSLHNHLTTILTLFKDILHIVKTLHDQKVTHYDIKADNILLQIDQQDSNKIKAVFGDFGQCKIFDSEKDQLDLKSRGTQCIKSPQMLTLALQSKKQSDHYDRRKKIGTSRLSDIWSLGCLFYEMLTGQYLFHRHDWVNFYVHVTSHNQELLTKMNYQKLGNNTLLIQFLKFMLIRDPQHRPSIGNLINKYQTVYAYLVNIQSLQIQNSKSPLAFNQTLDHLIQSYINEISNPIQQDVLSQSANLSLQRANKHKTNGSLMKIMDDIYYCDSENYFIANIKQLKQQGITHVISSFHHQYFNTFLIESKGNNICSLAYKLCPRISDVLREVLLLKGKMLFVNDSSNYAVNLLIYTLSYWFRCSVYQTWCLINTQILLFPAFSSHLIKLSSSLQILNKIQNHVQTLPKLQCICGSVTLILKKRISDKKGQFKICKCESKVLYELSDNEKADCPSLGCGQYLQFLKKRYNISWENIKWIKANQSHFLTSVIHNEQNDNIKGKLKQSLRAQIILNSAHPFQNMINGGSSIKNWKIYQCKVCQMWMLGLNQHNQIWVVMNNLIRRSRQGIMIPNAQQDFKMRTPALNYFTLSKLHMTSP